MYDESIRIIRKENQMGKRCFQKNTFAKKINVSYLKKRCEFNATHVCERVHFFSPTDVSNFLGRRLMRDEIAKALSRRFIPRKVFQLVAAEGPRLGG